MTETSYPFDAGAGAAVNEAQWQAMARRFLATGVVDDSLNELAVSADGSAMSVSVATGDAFVEGFFYRNDAAKAMTISTAHATLGRIDTVVVRLDRTANSATLVVVTGTAAASPVAPTLSATDSLYELPLANVRVDPAVGVIAAGKVTDRRVLVKNLTEAAAIAAYVPLIGKAAMTDTGTSADVSSHSLIRTASYVGGAAGFVNGALKVQTDVSSGVTAYEWGIRSILNNSATAGQNAAMYGQGVRSVAAAGPTFAGVFELLDLSTSANPALGSVAVEVDINANGTDTSNNRIGIDLFVGHLGTGSATACTAYAGIRLNSRAAGDKWTHGILVTGANTNALTLASTSTGVGVDLSGTTNVGISFSSGTHTTAAIRLGRGQKIAWESTSTITSTLAAAASQILFAYSGTTRVAIGVDPAGPGVAVNDVFVIGPRRTGWAAATGTATRTAFDTTTVSLSQLAERVKALLDDLLAHGLVGA